MELLNAALGAGGEGGKRHPHTAATWWELPEGDGLCEACGGLRIGVPAFVSSQSPSFGFS